MPALRILDRYVAREILLPFAAALGFFFQLMFAMQMLQGTDVIMGSATRGSDLALLALFLAPHFLAVSLPVALLLAILLGFGRLAEDRELAAAAAAGVGPLELLPIPLALGAAASVLSLLLGTTVEPAGLSAVRRHVNEIIKRNVAGDVRPGIFYEDLTDLTLYAEKVDRRGGWQNVLVHDERDRSAPLLILARQGRVDPVGEGGQLALRLEDGELHRAKGVDRYYSVASFDRGSVAVAVEGNILRKNSFRARKEEMYPADLLEAAAEAKDNGQSPRPFLVAFHHRFASPFAALVFSLLGLPLAGLGKRSGRTLGYVATVAAFVVYYSVGRLGEALGESGRLHPLVAAQLPNLLFLALGVALLWKLVRRGPAVP